jgi:YidC/Oxa1 family membrane protein insertase
VDKKSLIGLGLIAAILGVWLYFSGPSKEQIAKNKHIRDSIEQVNNKARIAEEAAKIAAAQAADTLKPTVVVSDSAKAAEVASYYKDFSVATNGKSETFVIENENLKAYISNKGGQINKVELKNYHRPESTSNLVLFDKDSTRFALALKAYDNSRVFFTDSFYFKVVKQTPSNVVLRLETSKPGSYIEYSYALTPGSYLVNSEINFNGMQGILSQAEDQAN